MKIEYREFDVGYDELAEYRGLIRFVHVGDGSVYYTDNYYISFVKIKQGGKMKNQIFRISKLEKEKRKNAIYDRGAFVVEIESDSLKNNELFMEKMSRLFKFPYKVTNLNALNDYMTDLDWLNNEIGNAIFINDFSQISCASYDESIKIAETNFVRMIRWLYYWEEEVERVTSYWDEEKQIFSGGISPKIFNVYLVD